MHTRKVVAPDVFVENKCVTFDTSKALQITHAIPELAAVCIVSTGVELPREMELLDRCRLCNSFAVRQSTYEQRLQGLALHISWPMAAELCDGKAL
ncbi:MAG TPA: hypothetical protein VFM05_12335 [Candidatus Saccharimonadales bacterium]|nr:hypothetical protein [Candidatus Saccharimonadales bacterium]